MDQQFSLRWNNYISQLTDAFGSLRYEEDLVDVTLSCEGGKLKAHKMLLSACSSYFRDIFKENPCQHPVIVFRNVKLRDLQAILDFIYKGEVNVLQEHLESFLGTAELLEIKGLTEGNGKDITLEEEECSGVTTKNGQRIVREKVLPDSRTVSRSPSQRASARSTSPPVKKRRLNSRTKPSEGNQSEVEEETNETPIELKIEEEDFVEEQSFEEDEEDMKMPLSPTSDPLHVPDNSQSSFTNLDPSSIKPATNENLPTSGRGSSDCDSCVGFGVEKLPEKKQRTCCVCSKVCGDKRRRSRTVCVRCKKVEDGKTEKEERSTNQGNEVEKPSHEEDTSQTKEAAEEEVAQDTPKDKEISEPLEKKTTDTKVTKHEVKDKGCEDLEESIKPKVVSKSAQLKSSLKPKGGIVLPKGLTVTVSPVVKEQSQGNFTRLGEEDEITALSSEEAKTPVHEEPIGFQSYPNQQTDLSDVVIMGEPVMAEEATQVHPTSKEGDTPAEEEKEPEFDYYGCEVCKAEAKPVDKFNFNHKCPICPCACFCAHLLKEHMKIIHGWFNVQRRFTQF